MCSVCTRRLGYKPYLPRPMGEETEESEQTVGKPLSAWALGGGGVTLTVSMARWMQASNDSWLRFARPVTRILARKHERPKESQGKIQGIPSETKGKPKGHPGKGNPRNLRVTKGVPKKGDQSSPRVTKGRPGR